jgi:hypothetical protein
MSQDSQDRRTDRPGSPQNGAGKPPPETLTTRDEQTSRAAPFRSREVNELAIMGSAMAGRGPGRPSLPVAVRLRVLALRAEHRDWSLRKLGKAAGCSKDTVGLVWGRWGPMSLRLVWAWGWRGRRPERALWRLGRRLVAASGGGVGLGWPVEPGRPDRRRVLGVRG